MADFPLPATGAGSTGKKASTVLLSNGADVQNFQAGTATEGGVFTPIAIASQATLAAVLAALGSPYQAAGALPLPSGASTETTVAAVLAKLNASIAVTGPLTDAQLRATAVPVSGTVTAIGPVTDTQLRATPVPVSGTVTASGPLTDTQLRATAVPVSGTVAASEALADNAAFTDGTSKVVPPGYIFDETAGTALTENDVAAARIDAKRSQVGVIEDATTRGQRAAVSSAGALSVAVISNTAVATDGGGQDWQEIVGGYLVGGVPQGVDATHPFPTIEAVATSGGYSISRLLSAASTNATSAKASAGQVYGWYLFNSAAYTVFLKIYNKASAPTVGTDTPVLTIPIPAGAAANVEFGRGIAFATGIAYATTKLVADADTTVLVANDLIVNLLYK